MSEKLFNLSKVICQHKYFKSSYGVDIYFCKICGIMRYLNVTTSRPEKYKYPCEIDPLELLNKSATQDSQFILVDYNNEGHKDYLSKRKYLIESIKCHVEHHDSRKAITHLAVSYMDTIIMSTMTDFMNYELVAYVCFRLASKFYEFDPSLQVNSFNADDIKKSEVICLKQLSYKLNRLTAFDALEMLLKIGIIFENENEYNYNFNINDIYRFAIQTLEKFLYDERFVDFSPIQICFGIITFTREHFNLKGWTHKLATIYNTKLEDFMNCYFVIKTLYEDSLIKLNKSNNEADYSMIFAGDIERKQSKMPFYCQNSTLDESYFSFGEDYNFQRFTFNTNVNNQNINMNSYFNAFPSSSNINCMYYKDFNNISCVHNLYNSLLY